MSADVVDVLRLLIQCKHTLVFPTVEAVPHAQNRWCQECGAFSRRNAYAWDGLLATGTHWVLPAALHREKEKVDGAAAGRAPAQASGLSEEPGAVEGPSKAPSESKESTFLSVGSWGACDQCGKRVERRAVFSGGNGEVSATAGVCLPCLLEALGEVLRSGRPISDMDLFEARASAAQLARENAVLSRAILRAHKVQSVRELWPVIGVGNGGEDVIVVRLENEESDEWPGQ